MQKTKKLFWAGSLVALAIVIIALVGVAISYATPEAIDEFSADQNPKQIVAPEDSATEVGGLLEEESNSDPVISFNGLPEGYEITVQKGKDAKYTTTERSFPIQGIGEDETHYIVSGFVTGETKATVHVKYIDDLFVPIDIMFKFDTLPGCIITMDGISGPDENIPKTENKTATFSFQKIDNPKYYIKVLGGPEDETPLEGVDFWYMSNDGTVFPTVTTALNATGDEASAKYEVPADKLNGYFDVSYSKLEPDVVYQDDIDTLEFSDFEWDETAKEFVFEHEFSLKNRNLSTLLLTSDGNIKYFQSQEPDNGSEKIYCSPRISYNLSNGASFKISATCSIFDGGDVVCDVAEAHMTIPVKIFPEDGYVFDRWDVGGASYRAGDTFIIDDVRELTIGKIYFTNGALAPETNGVTETAQTGDAIPFAVLIALGIVAGLSVVAIRKFSK